ncbi:uncharacterized protein TNCV_1165621 [Trichonephila clavipes]|uniref:Uncharacterized protein n=1 Tax=Trichonephila clavipes TaxID=2585209 RepID=A0A8X6VST9_TRICX|nr:uncharacterized protein TNCV_1165621 [Trichonephila clavipes]
MMEAVWSARRVARQLSHSDCVVRRCWYRWIQEMSFTRRPGSGHPQQTSRGEDRHIVRNARVQPTASSAAIQAKVAPTLEATVSSRTIRRCLVKTWDPMMNPGLFQGDMLVSNPSNDRNAVPLDSQRWPGAEIPYVIDKSFTTRGLLARDHVILNHGQVTWTTPELAPPLLTTTPHQREDVSARDRFNVHRCPTRRVFSGTGLELETRKATVRYLYHSATAATRRRRRNIVESEIV